MQQIITWINADPVRRGIYAALGGDELRIHITVIIVYSDHIFIW